MTELDDHALLAEYARSESEAAFAALVVRYMNLVYATARRFTGNPHHAEEITQAVFIILARKAGSLRRGTVLSGWLYQTARLTAANFVKGEIRRQNREQKAYMQSTLTEPESAAWQQIAPLLDEAMGQLGETDRNAVVLRFFENKTAREAAVALKLNEQAAHKRVNRALEKLRKFFTKRGVTLSAALIAGAVSANSVQAAPTALAATAAKGAALGGSTLTLVEGTLKIMARTKMKTVAGAGAVILLLGVMTTIVFSSHKELLPAPDSVLMKVQEKYASLSSYSDTGTAETRSADSTLGTIRFKTLLARTNLYRIEWSQRQQNADQTNSGVIWSAGDGHFVLLNGTELQRFDQFAAARIEALTPTMGQFAFVLAPYYAFNGHAGWVSHIAYLRENPKSATLAKTEKIQGFDCYVIDGTQSNRTITVWISKDDYLIRQVREDFHNPGATTSRVSATQTHENIVLNKNLSPADFTRRLNN